MTPQQGRSRLLLYKHFLGLVAPILAVALAFAVNGLIILVFVKSYGLSNGSLENLKSSGVPKVVFDDLKTITGKDTADKETFKKIYDPPLLFYLLGDTLPAYPVSALISPVLSSDLHPGGRTGLSPHQLFVRPAKSPGNLTGRAGAERMLIERS